jgi:hypothetical protein
MRGCAAPVIILLAIIVFGMIISPGDDRAKSFYRDACANQDDKMGRIITFWSTNGVIREFHGSDIEVDERMWGSLHKRERMSILIAAYCRIADTNGNGVIRAISARTGDEVRGSMVNGNYFD